MKRRGCEEGRCEEAGMQLERREEGRCGEGRCEEAGMKLERCAKRLA